MSRYICLARGLWNSLMTMTWDLDSGHRTTSTGMTGQYLCLTCDRIVYDYAIKKHGKDHLRAEGRKKYADRTKKDEQK